MTEIQVSGWVGISQNGDSEISGLRSGSLLMTNTDKRIKYGIFDIQMRSLWGSGKDH